MGCIGWVRLEIGSVGGVLVKKSSVQLHGTSFMVGGIILACDGVRRSPAYRWKAQILLFHLIMAKDTFSCVERTNL